MIGLGDAKDITLADARDKAERLRIAIRDGADPVDEKKARRMAQTTVELIAVAPVDAAEDSIYAVSEILAGIKPDASLPKMVSIAAYNVANLGAHIDAGPIVTRSLRCRIVDNRPPPTLHQQERTGLQNRSSDNCDQELAVRYRPEHDSRRSLGVWPSKNGFAQSPSFFDVVHTSLPYDNGWSG